MKQKRILSMILCTMILICMVACRNEEKEMENSIYPDFLTRQKWEYNTLSCTEILNFYKDGSFSYYETCGNPVGNSDSYATYSYDENKRVVTVYGESIENLEIEILRHTEDSLLVRIEGVIKEFYPDKRVPSLMGDMVEEVEGYSAYVAIGDIHGDMIETAPVDFDVDAGGLKLVRKEKIAETAVFYGLNEELVHSEGENADEVKVEFTELMKSDVDHTEDNSFRSGYIWYNDELEIIKIVYYGSLEIWE